MKTLRMARNIAALFILLMGLLASHPGVGHAQARSVKLCGYKPGSNGCYPSKGGGCLEGQKCKQGEPCQNWGCVGGL